jgi:hypothetical protein
MSVKLHRCPALFEARTSQRLLPVLVRTARSLREESVELGARITGGRLRTVAVHS